MTFEKTCRVMGNSCVNKKFKKYQKINKKIVKNLTKTYFLINFCKIILFLGLLKFIFF